MSRIDGFEEDALTHLNVMVFKFGDLNRLGILNLDHTRSPNCC
ncbi:MAG TPA: hypothetical protein VFQ36_15295 [Ktedonobacteraceae bacterium]|nr:hypothetical protein [Ktedonobacteraceae bacterium]